MTEALQKNWWEEGGAISRLREKNQLGAWQNEDATETYGFDENGLLRHYKVIHSEESKVQEIDALPAAIRITIDGPAAAGKGTLARQLAEKYGADYVETGAIYRAITDYLLKKHDCAHFDEGMKEQLTEEAIAFVKEINPAMLKGDHLRTENVELNVPFVATTPEIRYAVKDHQIEMADKALDEGRSIVMEGRDVGERVLSDAELKLFITAPIDVRIARRLADEQKKSPNVDLRKIEERVRKRDEKDTNNILQPNKAIVIDTGSYEKEQTFAIAERQVRAAALEAYINQSQKTNKPSFQIITGFGLTGARKAELMAERAANYRNIVRTEKRVMAL